MALDLDFSVVHAAGRPPASNLLCVRLGFELAPSLGLWIGSFNAMLWTPVERIKLMASKGWREAHVRKSGLILNNGAKKPNCREKKGDLCVLRAGRQRQCTIEERRIRIRKGMRMTLWPCNPLSTKSVVKRLVFVSHAMHYFTKVCYHPSAEHVILPKESIYWKRTFIFVYTLFPSYSLGPSKFVPSHHDHPKDWNDSSQRGNKVCTPELEHNGQLGKVTAHAEEQISERIVAVVTII